MSNKRKSESKKDRKKRCELSYSKQKGIRMLKNKKPEPKMPTSWEEAEGAGIIK